MPISRFVGSLGNSVLNFSRTYQEVLQGWPRFTCPIAVRVWMLHILSDTWCFQLSFKNLSGCIVKCHSGVIAFRTLLFLSQLLRTSNHNRSPANQFSSVAQSRLTLCDPMNRSTPGTLSITSSRSLLRPMSIESMMPSNHLILCRPLLFLSPVPPRIRVFSNELTLCMRWPKYWSFSFSISPSNEHPGLTSFRMDWLDLLAVQGTLKSLLQHHSSKASILWYSAFFTVQLSHPYMTTGKTIALTRWTFVGTVMSLLFNMLSRLVITFPSKE